MYSSINYRYSVCNTDVQFRLNSKTKELRTTVLKTKYARDSYRLELCLRVNSKIIDHTITVKSRFY